MRGVFDTERPNDFLKVVLGWHRIFMDRGIGIVDCGLWQRFCRSIDFVLNSMEYASSVSVIRIEIEE